MDADLYILIIKSKDDRAHKRIKKIENGDAQFVSPVNPVTSRSKIIIVTNLQNFISVVLLVFVEMNDVKLYRNVLHFQDRF